MVIWKSRTTRSTNLDLKLVVQSNSVGVLCQWGLAFIGTECTMFHFTCYRCKWWLTVRVRSSAMFQLPCGCIGVTPQIEIRDNECNSISVPFPHLISPVVLAASSWAIKKIQRFRTFYIIELKWISYSWVSQPFNHQNVHNSIYFDCIVGVMEKRRMRSFNFCDLKKILKQNRYGWLIGYSPNGTCRLFVSYYKNTTISDLYIIELKWVS